MIIDYLQLVQGRAWVENRQQEIAEITRSEGLARELEVPVVALAQLSRAVEATSDSARCFRTKESGEIEAVADVVAFIYREDYYKPDIEPERRGIAEIIIAKQRNGPTGFFELLWQREIHQVPQPRKARAVIELTPVSWYFGSSRMIAGLFRSCYNIVRYSFRWAASSAGRAPDF